MFGKLAIRDLVILSATAALWWALVHTTVGDGVLADFNGLLLGLAFGLCVFLAHEWGHLLGALATSSAVQAPSRLTSGYLFSYDSKRNSRRQFLIMSFSGFAVTGLAVWIVYALLPDAALATRVARGAVLFLTSLTVFIEFPIVIVSLFRKALPPVEVFSTSSVETEDAPQAAA